MDEFFRVRVATLSRMIELSGKKKLNMHLELEPDKILEQIQSIVLEQQSEFAKIWEGVQKELEQEKIFIVNEKQLNKEQQKFVEKFYDD